MTRRDFQILARLRLNEAEVLFAAGLYSGSYYLAGYAIECALKACIAKQTQRFEFPDKRRAESSHTHRLLDLVRTARLDTAMGLAERESPEIAASWRTAGLWSEQSRYTQKDRVEAEALLHAARDRRSGIIPWLKKHW
ncbi:MAG: HEPN domain-containing protein [Acidobacteria bacterium]|nr:HEPN domain-containing protein [Acidobacteriota bacterium]